MTKPKTLGSQRPSELARILAGLAERGLDTTPGPVDNTPSPDEPGHPEYHRRRRAEWALTRWEAAAPRRYRNATTSHPDVIAWADLAANNPDDAGALLLAGPVGTGKTHQAYGALRRIAETGPRRYELIATTAPDMYGLLRPGGSQRSSEDELNRLCRVPLLLVDDLGSAKASEWVEEVTYRLINERYNACLPSVFTSNLPVRADGRDDLTGKLGERIASRLAQTTTVVPLVGPDRRRGGGLSVVA